MPFRVVKNGDKYVVENSATREEASSHSTRSAALVACRDKNCETSAPAAFASVPPALVSRKERERIPAGNFADPDNKLFPVRTADDLQRYETDIFSVIGKAAVPLRERARQIAKAGGFLDESAFASEDDAAQEELEASAEFKITAAERKATASEDFGDPANRRFPIRNQGDLDSAAHLIGRASPAVKKRIIAIARRKGLNLPKSWSDAKMRVTFESDDYAVGESLFGTTDDSYADGDYVIYPQRKLFPADWYDSHKFGLSPEDLYLVPFVTANADMDLEHKSTVIREEFIGKTENFSVGWEGDRMVLRGDVAIHSALNPLLKDEAKMSTTWDRGTNSLVGVALLLNPRVEDATLKTFAVNFAKSHTTKSGKLALQRMHDESVKAGAVCQAGNQGQAKYASVSENKTIQTIHDATVDAGALCEGANHDIWTYFKDDPGGASGMADATNNTDVAALTAKVKKQEDTIAQFAAERRKAKIDAAYAKFRDEGKLTPGRESTFRILADALLLADNDSGEQIKFSETFSGGMFDGFYALLDNMPKPASLTQERLKFNDSNEKRIVLSDDAHDADGDSFTEGLKASARRQAANGRKVPAGDNGKKAGS